MPLSTDPNSSNYDVSNNILLRSDKIPRPLNLKEKPILYEQQRSMSTNLNENFDEFEEIDLPINQKDSQSISTTQKMISACSGSILTSLFITPLDVVRVRLQLQHTNNNTNKRNGNEKIYSHIKPLLNKTTQSKINNNTNQCCRDVFWLSPNKQYCVVSDNSSSSCFLKGNDTTLSNNSNIKTFNNNIYSNQKINGTWQGLISIAKNEGITSLWRGLSPTLLMAAPSNIIYFVGYEYLRDHLFTSSNFLQWAPILSGSFARTISTFAISPFELFKTRLQSLTISNPSSSNPSSSNPSSSNPNSSRILFKATWDGLKNMAKEEGIHTLWRGLTMTLWRDVPFSAVYWLGYEFLKDSFHANNYFKFFNNNNNINQINDNNTQKQFIRKQNIDSNYNNFISSFMAGAISGSLAAVLTTPFDVGKTRIQVYKHGIVGSQDLNSNSNSISNSKDKNLKPYKVDNMLSVLKKIAKEDGPMALFRGVVPRILKVAPSCAIMISSYELSKGLFSINS